MKAITKYRCDLCGAEYFTESEAIHCEAWHHQPATFDDKEWMFGNKYPDKLNVEMDNGVVCQYQYCREMRGAAHD